MTGCTSPSVSIRVLQNRKTAYYQEQMIDYAFIMNNFKDATILSIVGQFSIHITLSWHTTHIVYLFFIMTKSLFFLLMQIMMSQWA